MIVALALTVLNHRQEVKFEGGVMLPGAAFGESEVVLELLSKEGVVIEVVASQDSKADTEESKV
jgi:hypothetical protein